MGRTIILIVAIVSLFSCKHKKKTVTLSGEDPVDVSTFVDFFPPLKLPFQYADSNLQKKETDSFLVSRANFDLFLPDSILQIAYPKENNPSIYALGKFEAPGGETYLFLKTVLKDKRLLYIAVLDKKKQYVGSLPILKPDPGKNIVRSILFDRKLTITRNLVQKNADGSSSEGKDVYVYNADSRNFMLIMTDPLVDKTGELVNPIDTLQRKNKFSADYVNGKMNLVSIRDGKRPGELNFFIHFEKDNNACTGELKGEAVMRAANTAEYKEQGDPCVLRFIFSSNSVTLQEVEGCGSKRPLNCTLNGRYSKKVQKTTKIP